MSYRGVVTYYLSPAIQKVVLTNIIFFQAYLSSHIWATWTVTLPYTRVSSVQVRTSLVTVPRFAIGVKHSLTGVQFSV